MDENVLAEARRSFRSFYGAAKGDDAIWMNTLVLAWTALTKGMCIPREVLPPAARNNLEHACDDAERRFMEARDQVRTCGTFRNLAPGDQRRIAGILFELYPTAE